MRREISVVVLGILVSGCAESPPPIGSRTAGASSFSPAESAQASSVASPRIDLQPLTISFQGKPIARLFADGRTESAGQAAPGSTLTPGPTLHADGTMVMTRGGVTARLDDSGDIHVVQPPGVSPRERLFGRITGDELSFAGSERPWSVRVRGNVIEFGEDNSSVIDGDVTPGMRRAALVMAAAFTIDGAIPSR
ncbi:MAG: hypothetical protein U0414_38345 [Polyangiaceae bacterium]